MPLESDDGRNLTLALASNLLADGGVTRFLRVRDPVAHCACLDRNADSRKYAIMHFASKHVLPIVEELSVIPRDSESDTPTNGAVVALKPRDLPVVEGVGIRGKDKVRRAQSFHAAIDRLVVGKIDLTLGKSNHGPITSTHGV